MTRTTQYKEKPPVSENKSRRVWIYFENSRPGATIKAINYIHAALSWAVEYSDGKYDSVRFKDIPTGPKVVTAAFPKPYPRAAPAPAKPMLESKSCQNCSKPFPVGTTQQMQKYCSIPCKRAVKNRRYAERRAVSFTNGEQK